VVDNVRGLKWGSWALKSALASSALGFLLMYAAEHSVTVAQLNEAIASLPLAFILLIELFDKVADKNDYYNKLVGQFGAKQSRGTAVLIAILFAALGWFIVLWALAGTITLNIGSYTPASLVAAGLVALYVFLPETGDDELLLWLWIAATIATKGAYIAVLPGRMLDLTSMF